MTWWEKRIHFSRGMTSMRSCSMFFGSLLVVSSRRREMRWTCVSTTTPSAILNQLPRTTLAVLRATPGSVSRSCMLRGTCPPKSATIFLAAPTTDLDLFRRKRGEGFHRGIFAEKLWGDTVDVDVRGLRGKYGRDQQFPSAAVCKGAGNVWIELVQAV